MGPHVEQSHADKSLAASDGVESGLSDKQSSGDSYQSAETSRYVTAASTAHSPNNSRSVTPEPLSPTTSASGVTEGFGFDPRNTNLDHFHGEARFDQQISAGEFTKVKGLSDCCRNDGKVELHHWTKTSPGEGDEGSHQSSTVVIKRVLTSRVSANAGKERNERIVYRGHCQRHAEDCLNEIGVYCYLDNQCDLPQYILKMHTVFQAGSDVWLVLEHANDGDLFAVAQKLKREGNSLSVSQLMMWTWQLLQAVCYLHKHGIGHRDISMENVLLCNGEVRLMDFGQCVQTHSAGGSLLRYFNALGKPYYRPPECQTPMQKSVEVHVPQGAHPGEVAFVRTSTGNGLIEVLLPLTALPGQICTAEPWGYAVPPVDVFAVGVCMFIMATGMPPWRQANLSDQHFAWVHQCGISQLLKAWKKPMPAASDMLMAAMVQSDPTKRPSLEQCLSHGCFNQMKGMAVPVHRMRAYVPPTSTCAVTTTTTLASTETTTFATTAGDPYTEDATVRSAAAPVDMPCGLEAFGGMLAGDFYHIPDNLCRSGLCSLEQLTLERFSVDDLPPKAPLNEAFAFEPTTFQVSGMEPAELGNHILDLLTMAAGAVVKKIRSSKFSIKAEVNGEDGACTFKVRIYDQGGGTYAVEFQRRCGESVALHKVFDQASDHLATSSKPVAAIADKSGTAADAAREADAQVNDSKAPSASQQVAANRTWPLLPTCSATSLQRPRGRPGTMARQQSTPAPSRSKACANGSSKIATADVLEHLASERAKPAGSGLNAVRSRSKSTMRRPTPNIPLPPALRLNTTM